MERLLTVFALPIAHEFTFMPSAPRLVPPLIVEPQPYERIVASELRDLELKLEIAIRWD